MCFLLLHSHRHNTLTMKEGLYIERRGRKSTGRPPKLKKEVEEDLIAEVQRLRAENAYLKKLNALVAERVRQEKKHK